MRRVEKARERVILTGVGTQPKYSVGKGGTYGGLRVKGIKLGPKSKYIVPNFSKIRNLSIPREVSKW